MSPPRGLSSYHHDLAVQWAFVHSVAFDFTLTSRLPNSGAPSMPYRYIHVALTLDKQIPCRDGFSLILNSRSPRAPCKTAGLSKAASAYAHLLNLLAMNTRDFVPAPETQQAECYVAFATCAVSPTRPVASLTHIYSAMRLGLASCALRRV